MLLTVNCVVFDSYVRRFCLYHRYEPKDIEALLLEDHLHSAYNRSFTRGRDFVWIVMRQEFNNYVANYQTELATSASYRDGGGLPKGG